MKRSITPELHRNVLVLGYAPNKDEEALLLSKGVTRVWLKGRGAEGLKAHRIAFRKRAGVFAIAADLRILSDKSEVNPKEFEREQQRQSVEWP